MGNISYSAFNEITFGTLLTNSYCLLIPTTISSIDFNLLVFSHTFEVLCSKLEALGSLWEAGVFVSLR